VIGKEEVQRRKKGLDDALERFESGAKAGTEIQSDLARYYCVLLSGFVEKSIVTLLTAYAQEGTNKSVQRYVGNNLSKLRNPNEEKAREILKVFNPEWSKKFKDEISDAQAAAIDSVVLLRNKIAHGVDTDVTIDRVREYKKLVFDVVELVEQIVSDEK
jgi:hypothetical protein